MSHSHEPMGAPPGPSREPGPRSLQLHEDLAFERRNWAVQRVSWGLIAVFLLAALLGLLGNGPLSTARVRSGPVELEYNRFERLQAPSVLVFRLHPGVPAGRIELWFSRTFMEGLQVQRITPQPSAARAEADRLVFAFEVSPLERQTSISFRVIPIVPGFHEARAGQVGGPELSLWQFVYP